MTTFVDNPNVASAETSQKISRAGRLACFCPPGVPVEGAAANRRPALLAGGFSLAVLSQTLVLGVLPLAGLLLAPQPKLATLPYIAMLCGAAVATLRQRLGAEGARGTSPKMRRR